MRGSKRRHPYLIIQYLIHQVPDPLAYFPLNAMYGTKEIKDRAPQGIPHGVNLAPGPHGQADSSYEFHGNSESYIEFPNSEGGALDVFRHSMTMLCWVYYDGMDGPLFVYSPGGYNFGVNLLAFKGKLYSRFRARNYGAPNFFLWSTLLAGGWKFVGATYERSSGEAKLWVNGVAVQSTNMGAGIDLGTQSNARMGASIKPLNYFKGRITQMRVYDVALTQEQIQEIYGKNVFFLFSYRKIINVGKR